MFRQGEYITLGNYHILKNNMKSLDLLLFRGDDIISDTISDISRQRQQISFKETISSNCNTLLRTNDFTHAGLIIHPSLLPDCGLDHNKLYILESTFSHKIIGMNNGPTDYLTNEYFFGVQLRDLELVCHSYIKNDKTKIMWLPLSLTPKINNFSLIFNNYHKRPFLTEKIIDFQQITPELMLMAKSILNETLLLTILKNAFSCVNLVVSIYSDIKIIPTGVSLTYPYELLTLTQMNTLS